MTVYFIGAGPGDPELITVKGLRLLQQCPVVLYAGSLIPEAIIESAASDAQVTDTAPLHLEQIIEHIKQAHQAGKDVARLHSGDPSLYGAVGEQMRHLDQLDIPYEIIPGVTATSASAAALKCELTLPDISQTIIHTRYAGKTSMPEGEGLSSLAQHTATLAIHLGITRIHKIVEELIPFYGEDCPVSVCYRTSWEDEKILKGTLTNITQQVRDHKISRTALILVGGVLDPKQFSDSYLYHEDKANIYRPRKRSKITKAKS